MYTERFSCILIFVYFSHACIVQSSDDCVSVCLCVYVCRGGGGGGGGGLGGVRASVHVSVCVCVCACVHSRVCACVLGEGEECLHFLYIACRSKNLSLGVCVSNL